MILIKEKHCGNCTYWREYDSRKGWGACRRFPPQWFTDEDVGSGTVIASCEYSSVEESSWCGEHVSG